MAGETCWFRVTKRALMVLVLGALMACSRVVPIKPAFDQPLLFAPIPAQVGSIYLLPIHETHYFKTPDGLGVFAVDFDHASQSRFEQVFAALFSDVTPLPNWPPWRDSPMALDGVIELADAELTAILGDDMGRSGEHVTVRYRICLYNPKGDPVACWEPQAEQHHQRQLLERNLDLNLYLATLVETASRQAIAEFMLAFEQDPSVKQWAQQLGIKP